MGRHGRQLAEDGGTARAGGAVEASIDRYELGQNVIDVDVEKVVDDSGGGGPPPRLPCGPATASRPRTLGSRPKKAIAAIKRSVYFGGSMHLPDGLHTERTEFLHVLGSLEAQAITKAYMQSTDTVGELPLYNPGTHEAALSTGRRDTERPRSRARALTENCLACEHGRQTHVMVVPAGRGNRQGLFSVVRQDT